MSNQKRSKIFLDHLGWRVWTARAGGLPTFLRNVLLGAAFIIVVFWTEKAEELKDLIVAPGTFHTQHTIVLYFVTLTFFLGATAYAVGTIIGSLLRRPRGRLLRHIKLRSLREKPVSEHTLRDIESGQEPPSTNGHSDQPENVIPISQDPNETG